MEKMKPVVKLVGENGNTMNLLRLCARALKKENLRVEAQEMSDRVFNCSSSDEALWIMQEYVEVI
jgi:hypothetical protein